MNTQTFLTCISTFFFLLASDSAWAHAMLEKSSPTKNEVLKAAPKQIALTFAHPVKLTQFKLLAQDQNGREMVVPVDLKASVATSIVLPVPQLAAGKYQATWSALSNDGHIMRGHLPFSIEINNVKP